MEKNIVSIGAKGAKKNLEDLLIELRNLDSAKYENEFGKLFAILIQPNNVIDVQDSLTGDTILEFQYDEKLDRWIDKDKLIIQRRNIVKQSRDIMITKIGEYALAENLQKGGRKV